MLYYSFERTFNVKSIRNLVSYIDIHSCEFIAPFGEESPGNEERRTSQKEGVMQECMATESASEI